MTGIEEVLALSRELERVQDELPESDPQRAAIAAEIARIRDLYRRLTDQSEHTATLLKASQRTIERAHAAIVSANQRLHDRAVGRREAAIDGDPDPSVSGYRRDRGRRTLDVLTTVPEDDPMSISDSLVQAMHLPADSDTVHRIHESGLAIANVDTMSQAIHDVYCGIMADHHEPNDKDRDQARAMVEALQKHATGTTAA